MPVKLLECLFARPKENWDLAFHEDKDFFQKNLPDKKLDVVRADPDTFAEQVHWTNAIYIRGGSTQPLLDLLLKDIHWQKVLDGKTFAGSSAGANAIAKYYYGVTDLKLGQGLGLVAAKVTVHYRSDHNAPNVDWDKAYAELKSYKEDLPLLTLKEGEFKVMNA